MFDLRIDQESFASQFDDSDPVYAATVRGLTYEQWSKVEGAACDEVYECQDIRDGIYDAIDNVLGDCGGGK